MKHTLMFLIVNISDKNIPTDNKENQI